MPPSRAISANWLRLAASAPQPTSIMNTGTSGPVNRRINATTQFTLATAMAMAKGTTTISARTG